MTIPAVHSEHRWKARELRRLPASKRDAILAAAAALAADEYLNDPALTAENILWALLNTKEFIFNK